MITRPRALFFMSVLFIVVFTSCTQIELPPRQPTRTIQAEYQATPEASLNDPATSTPEGLPTESSDLVSDCATLNTNSYGWVEIQEPQHGFRFAVPSFWHVDFPKHDQTTQSYYLRNYSYEFAMIDPNLADELWERGGIKIDMVFPKIIRGETMIDFVTRQKSEAEDYALISAENLMINNQPALLVTAKSSFGVHSYYLIEITKHDYLIFSPSPNAIKNPVVQAILHSITVDPEAEVNLPEIAPGLPLETIADCNGANDLEALMSGPWFSPLVSFAVEPDRALARQMFPSGTKQIYAMWEFGNMHPGLTIRREWYRDGQLWLEREEMWNMEKYGSNGTVFDISVYDFDNGLEAGSYLLKLFIDGQEFRSDGYMSQTFVIGKPEGVEPVLSPDELTTAFVDATGRLVMQAADGAQRTILNDPGITSLAWHPDSVHIFYSSYSSSLPPPTPHGFWNELWVVNIQTGEQWRLAGAEEDLHDPVVSPTGQYLALIGGSGFADACFVDKRLIILRLNNELKRNDMIEVSAFAGIVTEFEETNTLTFVYPVGDPIWRSNSALEVELNWTCTTDTPGGVYRLEIESLEATRKEGLHE